MNLETRKGAFPIEMLTKTIRADLSSGVPVMVTEYWLGGEIVLRGDDSPLIIPVADDAGELETQGASDVVAEASN